MHEAMYILNPADFLPHTKKTQKIGTQSMRNIDKVLGIFKDFLGFGCGLSVKVAVSVISACKTVFEVLLLLPIISFDM
jgi:hypothetical protein